MIVLTHNGMKCLNGLLGNKVTGKKRYGWFAAKMKIQLNRKKRHINPDQAGPDKYFYVSVVDEHLKLFTFQRY